MICKINNTIIKLIMSTILLLCLLGMPNDYFHFMRFVRQ
ncbi:DUF6804 family protein [Flavobacterium sp. CG_9.1]